MRSKANVPPPDGTVAVALGSGDGVIEGVGEAGTTVVVPTEVGDTVAVSVSVATGVVVMVTLTGTVWMVSAVPVVLGAADAVGVPEASVVGLDVAEGMAGISVLVGKSVSGVAVGASSAVGVEIGAKTIS
jgi:hypothetical protein